jgi:hypothetical protein
MPVLSGVWATEEKKGEKEPASGVRPVLYRRKEFVSFCSSVSATSLPQLFQKGSFSITTCFN